MSKKDSQITKRPSWSTQSTASRTQWEQSITTKSKYYNKEDGSSVSKTEKETYSSGAFGRGGHKDEHKVTNTYRVGDSKGYSEYKVEEWFRTVEYGNKSNHNKTNNTTNNTITYAPDYGYGYAPDYDSD